MYQYQLVKKDTFSPRIPSSTCFFIIGVIHTKVLVFSFLWDELDGLQLGGLKTTGSYIFNM